MHSTPSSRDLLKPHWHQPVGVWRERGASPALLRVGLGLSPVPAGPWIDSSGYTIWHYWAHSPRPQETFATLLALAGTDLLDRTAATGAHPWHFLLLEGRAGALKAWADTHGIPHEPPAIAATGDTFSHCVAWAGQTDLVQLFEGEGLSSINAPDAQGFLPLMIALHRGDVDFVQRFLMAGADPTLGDQQGKTALHHAAQYGNQDLFMLLEDFGADPTQPDNNGIEAQSLFKARRHLGSTDIAAIREYWTRRRQARLPF